MRLRSCRSIPPALRRFILRVTGLSALLSTLFFLYRYWSCVQFTHEGCSVTPFRLTARPIESFAESAPGSSKHGSTPSSPSVNLVVASVVGDDISWTSRISIPNINVIRYYTNDPKAKYHPIKPKGREALMYHTYLHDFYDTLPDISIFIHAHESPWHVEPVLFSNLSFALSHLDLDHVQQRQYVNLRVTWSDGCPSWINTSNTDPELSEIREEPFMRQAFLDNFSPEDGSAPAVAVPEILGAPCCNQFAVTRQAIRSVPKKQYARHIEWLATTELTDYISGRVWEHMFQYLFTRRAVDCPIEYKTLCRMYHICFTDAQSLQDYVALGWEKSWLELDIGFWTELWWPEKGQQSRDRIKMIDSMRKARVIEAMERGKDEEFRTTRLGDLYVL